MTEDHDGDNSKGALLKLSKTCSLQEAIRWIASRDPQLFALGSAVGPNEPMLKTRRRRNVRAKGQHLSRGPMGLLLEALQDGVLQAKAFAKEGDYDLVPSSHWHTLEFCLDKDDQNSGEADTSDFFVATTDIQSLWPPFDFTRFAPVPPTCSPMGQSGYVTLYEAAYWIASKGNAITPDLSDLQTWRLPYRELLSCIMTDDVKVVGIAHGHRTHEQVPGHKFIGCLVSYPHERRTARSLLRKKLVLVSCATQGEDQAPNTGDSLRIGPDVLWSRLMVEAEYLASFWPSELPAVSKTGARGRPTLRPIILAELNSRHQCGEMLLTVGREAEALIRFLRGAYPKESPLRRKSMERIISEEHRKLRQTPK